MPGDGSGSWVCITNGGDLDCTPRSQLPAPPEPSSHHIRERTSGCKLSLSPSACLSTDKEVALCKDDWMISKTHAVFKLIKLKSLLFFQSIHTHTHTHMLILKYLPIHLKSDLQRERKRYKSSISWFTFQMVKMTRVGPSQSQEYHPDLPYDDMAPSIWAISIASPDISAESWIKSGAARTWTGTNTGFQLYQWQFNSLCHGASPSYMFKHTCTYT